MCNRRWGRVDAPGLIWYCNTRGGAFASDMQEQQDQVQRGESMSASVAGAGNGQQPHVGNRDPESDYASDDDPDTASRNGLGKRKRPISVSYVFFFWFAYIQLFIRTILAPFLYL